MEKAELEKKIKNLEKEVEDLNDENELLEQNLEDTFKEKVAAKDENDNLKKIVALGELKKVKDENKNLLDEVKAS